MPELLIFDEPTDGLDPVAVRQLRNILKGLQANHGITIVLSSHMLVEVEKLADTMIVLDEGRQLFTGSPADLLDEGSRLVINIDGEVEAGVEAFRSRGLAPEVNVHDQITLPPGSIRLDEASELLNSNGLRLIDFHEKRSTLEEALLSRLLETRTSAENGGQG